MLSLASRPGCFSLILWDTLVGASEAESEAIGRFLLSDMVALGGGDGGGDVGVLGVDGEVGEGGGR
jgi:hypothetical protein